MWTDTALLALLGRPAARRQPGQSVEVLNALQQARLAQQAAGSAHLAAGEDVGLATVYRVLTQFEQAGLLNRNHFETGKAIFELNEGKHHDHLVCVTCGRVEEFFDAEIEKRQHAVAKAKGFAISNKSISCTFI